MTEAEARKANFIDGEMQDKYYANNERFTPEDISLAYDRGKSDAELDFCEYCKKLEHTIARMKCCENCRHNYFDDEEIRHCNVLNQHQMVVFKKCDKWELRDE